MSVGQCAGGVAGLAARRIREHGGAEIPWAPDGPRVVRVDTQQCHNSMFKQVDGPRGAITLDEHAPFSLQGDGKEASAAWTGRCHDVVAVGGKPYGVAQTRCTVQGKEGPVGVEKPTCCGSHAV